jgi:crossover junction endodeoxyribonuclease RusA
MIVFEVEGTPRPQGSKRHVGRGIMVESSKHVAEWRSWVRLCAANAFKGLHPLVGAVQVNITFYFDRPQAHSTKKGLRTNAPTYKVSKPDIDKLLRAVLDAMTGICFADDSQVVAIYCTKKFSRAAVTKVEVFNLSGESE